MNPEAAEVLAANALPAERRRYFHQLANEADLLRSFLKLEEAADAAMQRAEAQRWARRLGLKDAVAPLVRVLLHAESREHRQRAAAMLCAKLGQRAVAA